MSPLSPLLAVVWGTWAGAAVKTMLNMWCVCLCSLADSEWQYLNSVRHHSKALLMQNYPLTLLKSNHMRRAHLP